jgi:hypothetical protein
MEDFYGLFQLSPHRCHYRWKNFHYAWRIISRPFLNGTNSTCYASDRCPGYWFGSTPSLCILIIGLLCDLLWSDPDKDITGWSENDRGVSFTFGPDVVSRFLQKHDMDLICRAHQVVEDGYEFFSKRQLVTLFSAPNYCGEFDNAGAMMSVDESLLCSFQVLTPAQLLTNNRFWNPLRRNKSTYMAEWELDDLLLHHVKWRREERTRARPDFFCFPQIFIFRKYIGKDWVSEEIVSSSSSSIFRPFVFCFVFSRQHTRLQEIRRDGEGFQGWMINTCNLKGGALYFRDLLSFHFV